jgi:hypothetical protein
MKRYEAVLFSVFGLVSIGCAGKLDNPEKYEQGVGTARGDDAGTDAGSTDGDDGTDGTDGSDGTNTGDGDAKSDAGGGNGNPAPSCDFKALVQMKCATSFCHDSTTHSQNLDLSKDDLGTELKDRKGTRACSDYNMIDSTDATQSLLYVKVTDKACGTRMPLGGNLTEDEQKCILSWIEGL